MTTCPFKDCTKQLPDNLFCCKPHWFSLAKHLRAEIWTAYDAYMQDKIGLSALRAIQRQVLAEHYREPAFQLDDGK